MKLTDSELLDKLESLNTLHQSIETLYVVDGYEVTICYDGEPRVTSKGETLRQAIENL